MFDDYVIDKIQPFISKIRIMWKMFQVLLILHVIFPSGENVSFSEIFSISQNFVRQLSGGLEERVQWHKIYLFRWL